MNGSELEKLIEQKLEQAFSGDKGFKIDDNVKKCLTAVAEAVVEHIQNNADVSGKSDIIVDPSFWNWMNAFKTAFSSWIPVSMDGGAVLKTLITSSVIPLWPNELNIKGEKGVE